VTIVNVLFLGYLLSLPAPMTNPLEKAFLQNSAEALAQTLTAEGSIPVSLAEPLSLADQLSPDQAYLVFRRIFSVYKTTEFFATPGLMAFPGRAGGILKARWSFRNERTGNTYPMRIYFYLAPEPGPGGRVLRIIEIRTEKL
jgi:hypothetical protein